MMSGSRTIRPQHGFTLIEIMVAVGILGMVIVAIYTSWSVILQGARVGQEAAVRAQRERMTLRTLETALKGAQVFSANARQYEFIVDTGSESAFLSFVSYLPPAFPGSGFYEGERIRRVTFTVEEGQGNELIMYQKPLLLATNSQHQAIPIRLMRPIEHFTLEFWDERQEEWIDEWTRPRQLPDQVRVSLGIAPSEVSGRREPREIARVVPIPGREVPPDSQTPESPFLRMNREGSEGDEGSDGEEQRDDSDLDNRSGSDRNR